MSIVEQPLGAKPRALITGATAGIGAEFARALAARGYDLVLVARTRARLVAMARDLANAHGVASEVLAADLTLDADLARVAARLEAAPPIDLLVNNAGFGLRHRFVRATPQDEANMVRVHMLAPTLLARAVLPGMIERGHGAVVNVSSVAAFAPSRANAIYGASKAYVNSFSEGLALELRGTGVAVQALCPGFTRTEFHARADLRMDKIPSFLWTDAATVVRASLNGLDRGKLIVVPGWQYQVLVTALRLLPRVFVVWVMGVAARRRS